uniref:DUF4218 domain-containing protein n=1 Tax=Tanacetum cinerariifolium TaxID=118510 RepID=A0A6L2LHP1_TANCI|nr:hypothetical protein [Tanacetum cinerariifolium]
MIACLNDLSYIPLNNEQNEPTQRDIGETSNDPTQAKRNNFEELYATANKELYPDCDYVIRLDFMEKFTYFKVKSKLTDYIFNEMLELFQNAFPTAKGYKLPPLYYAIKKTLKRSDVHFCPVCNTSRWKDSNTPRNKVPKKVLCYFPIIPRLQRLYKSSHAAKEMTCHATEKCIEPGKTAHVGHRRFLKKPYKWRRSLEFNGETKDEDPPREFSRDEIMTQLARLPTRVKGKHLRFGGVKIKRNVLVELNWTKRYVFYELEYWSFLTLKHNLDVIHIEKNVLESILNTLLMNDKSKDTAKARQDLKRLGIRSGLWLGQNKNEKCSKPQAVYSFTPEDRNKFSKPECSIAKGYIAEEALTFGSHYFQDVTMKFNRPDHNVDYRPPTCQFQVFKSLCKLIGLRSVIRIDHQELKKVICLSYSLRSMVTASGGCGDDEPRDDEDDGEDEEDADN